MMPVTSRLHARSALSRCAAVRLAGRPCPALWLLLSVALSGCGVGDENIGPQDAGPGDAVSSYCTLAIVSVAPASPLAPVIVQIEARIDRDNLDGIETFVWDVRSPAGADVPVEPQDPDGRSMAFDAAQAGPYAVTVSGAVQGVPCATASTTVNVGVPGAPTEFYRIRLVPAPDQGAPPQEQIVEVPGGANFELGTLTLGTGFQASGTVSATDVGPVAAYIRATPSGVAGAAALETFAGAGGVFELRLENRDHDVLVVPELNHVAPALFRGVSRARGFVLVLEPGLAIAGSVSAGGEPVAGARVAVRADGVPSTLGVADAAGAFTVRARSGVMELAVVPPEDSGLPRLGLDPDAGLMVAAMSGVAIAYAPELEIRTVAPQIMLPDGVTPAGFARVTWTAASWPGAGVLTNVGPGPVSMTGSVRVSQVAGADGVLPDIALPAAVYDVVIEPEIAGPAQAVTRLRVDLGPGVPAPVRLGLGPCAEVHGVVTGSGGAAVPGVRVSASPIGLLHGATAASATAVTATDGSFTLFLAGGGEYELTLTSASGGHGRARRAIETPAAGQALELGAIALQPAVRVSGHVAIAGTAGNAAGVTLRLSCVDCADMDADWPLAEAVSDSAGRFVLAVPDPAAEAAQAPR